MKKTDDLSAWRVFVTVARSGTLSAAAKALDVEVSSISRAIGGLERTLGCELVRRNMRPLKLTESGTTVQIEMWYGSPPGARVNGVCRA